MSGLGRPVLITSRFQGPDLWTGGAFGPEASLPVVLVGSVLSAVLLVLVVRRGKIVTPAWMRRLVRRVVAG